MLTVRSVTALAALWLVFLTYLGIVDHDALLVSLVLTPPFALSVYCALKSGNRLLAVFMVLGFIAHAVGAPFFFVSRNDYSFSGFGAVGSFDFDLDAFLGMYVAVVTCFLTIVVFTVLADKTSAFLFADDSYPARNPAQSRTTSSAPLSPSTMLWHDGLIIVFIILVAVPINTFMYFNRIGILGVESPTLPFRLTGILYYSRLVLFPLVLIWLYGRSSGRNYLIVVVFAYALFAGLSSASRTVYLLSLLPVFFHLFLTKRYAVLAISLAVSLVGFYLVSASRDVVYGDHGADYEELIVTAIAALFEDERVSFLRMIGQIANRLYGAQDVVLAYQYEPAEPWLALARYFIQGGTAYTVVPNLNYEFYGLEFEEGSGFGVGIGLVTYLIVLGHSSLPRLIVGSLVVAVLLSVGDRCTRTASARIFGAHSYALGYFVALVVGFSLYSSSINFFVIEILFLVVLGWLCAMVRTMLSRKHAPAIAAK